MSRHIHYWREAAQARSRFDASAEEPVYALKRVSLVCNCGARREDTLICDGESRQVERRETDARGRCVKTIIRSRYLA